MNIIEKQQNIFGFILMLANKFQNMGDKIFDELTLKQWFLMLMISKMTIENPSIKQISDFTSTSRQNVKKMLDILGKKGFVTMEKNKTDERSFSVILTNKTKQFFVDNAQESEMIIENLFYDFNEKESESLYCLLLKLMNTSDKGMDSYLTNKNKREK